MSSENQIFASEFVDFLNEAVTPFHAVEASKKRLLDAGFVFLSEFDHWDLQRGGKYFFIRNDTSVIAFSVGSQVESSVVSYTVLAAHTDSPCLRVKPVACFNKGNALMVNTQPYGGGLWHTWFDRDLGLAGRAIVKDNDQLKIKLFHIADPIARIPNLAIHLTSGSEREAFAPNLQEHGKAVLSMDPKFVQTTPNEQEVDISNRIHPALLRMVAEKIGVESSSIEDLEMQLVDVQPATIGGAVKEFIYGGRLDNLCSSYQSLRALIDASTPETLNTQKNIKIAMLFDHEEVGSSSAQGAASSLFMDTITRIHHKIIDSTSESLMRSLRQSFVVSADMAHGLHPNYSSKHDSTMAPKINEGLVIKHNANQRYATNSLSATLFRRIGKLAEVPVQEFTVRSDSACGSTVGPIMATLSGILTVDVGTPQFSMHSIREMMGSHDAYTGYKHLKAVLVYHPDYATSFDSK